jgi:hypothetical protein
MNTINMPGFTAEASLDTTREHYCFAGLESAGRLGSVLAQSLRCSRVEEPCIPGSDLSCCSGLRCTARRPGEQGTCVPNQFRCSPCVDGRQFCCPPPGVGLSCFVRRCRVRL